jgi:hypothetical protein
MTIATIPGYRSRAASITREPSIPGQSEVSDDDVKGELVEQFEGALAAIGFDHLESTFSQPFGHQSAECGLVVDEE